MRLIQRRILPGSGPADLAEVLLSGLLTPVDAAPGRYEFLPGARQALLELLPREVSLATADTLEQVSAEIQDRAGTAASTFRALMRVAEGSGTTNADPDQQPFALVSGQALTILHRSAVPAAAPDRHSHATPDQDEADIATLVIAQQNPGVGRGHETDDPMQPPGAAPVPASGPALALAPVRRIEHWGLPARVDSGSFSTAAMTAALDELAPGPAGPRTVVVTGAHQVGKVAFAADAARQALARGWFPGGVIVADLSAGDFNVALARLLRTIGMPDDEIPGDAQAMVDLYQSILDSYPFRGHRVLLVVTHADQAAQVQPLLPRKDGAAIVTSASVLGLPNRTVIRLGSGRPAWVPGPALPAGGRAALLLTATRYEDPALLALPGAAKDAAELTAALESPAGDFTVGTLTDVGIKRLREFLPGFLRTLGAPETVLIHVACQVVANGYGDRPYFALRGTDRARLSETAFGLQELLDALNDCEAGRQLLILDCYSSGPSDVAIMRQVENATARYSRGRGRHPRREVLIVVQREVELGERTFSSIIAGGLLNGAADTEAAGLITAGDLYEYASRHITGERVLRRPMRWFDGPGEIIVARNPNGRLATPAPLPGEITRALVDRSTRERAGALTTLSAWLTDKDPLCVLAATQELQDAIDYDTPEVADVARSLLKPVGASSTDEMNVPLPRLGEVFFDVRGSSRSMRLSWYTDTGIPVFSIWQGGTCTATFRLPAEEIPRLAGALTAGQGDRAEYKERRERGQADSASMAEAPLPRLGEVFFDVRGSSRSMRLSWYTDTGIPVFSIWQGGTCTATFRLATEEVPRLAGTLTRVGDG